MPQLTTPILTLFFSVIILSAFVYLVILTEKQKKAKKSIERSLDKLMKAYDELDDQAKIIVKKDLELNKTQEELDKKLNGLYALHKLSKAISSTFEIEKLFVQINKSFISELNFDKGLIILVGNKEGYSLPAAVGYTAKEQENIKAIVREKKILIRTTKPQLVDRTISATLEKEELLQIFNLASLCIVPIISQEAKLGLIVVGNSTIYTQLTDGDLEILSILAGQIASGIENARLYEQLWHSHRDLEQRVTQRTKELALANEKLKKVDKLKSEFVSAVSHELRTPLTSIKGYASILMAGKLGAIPAAVKQRLEKVNKHSDSLTKLVNDLLDISRIDSGKVAMKLEKLDLRKIIDEVADIMAPPMKEKKISLSIELPAKIASCLADKTQFARVFINLLGNATKFTPVKGKITVQVKELKDSLQVNVQDSGIGIAEDNLSKVFEEFYRADNPINQEVKGTGLGLPLVKHIIEAHQGKIWVTSKVGKGATFSFTLPKA